MEPSGQILSSSVAAVHRGHLKLSGLVDYSQLHRHLFDAAPSYGSTTYTGQWLFIVSICDPNFKPRYSTS